MRYDFYKEVPDAPPLDIYGSYVEVVERRLGYAGILGGADMKVLKDWCTRFSSESEHLWEDIFHWE